MDLKSQEIFSTGTWNGMEFKEADLDNMVKTFDLMSLEGRVPLKFGHDSAKPEKDGKPALGWVSRIWRDGRKLMADFTHVPDAVMAAIKGKMYKHVSVELLKNVKAGTRELPWVLDAVALLGADQPAVGILKELEALTMSSRMPVLRFAERVTFRREFEKESNEMSEAAEKELAELRAKFTAAEAENAKLKAQNEERERVRKAEQISAHFKQLEGVVETSVKTGASLPAARVQFRKAFPHKDGDEAWLSVSEADVTAWLPAWANPDKETKKMSTKSGSSAGSEIIPAGVKTVDEAYTYAFNAQRDALGFSRQDAAEPQNSMRIHMAVRDSHPELYKSYVENPASDFKTDDKEAA